MKSIFTILLVVFSIGPASACSCSKIGILKCQKHSDFVFTGKVVEIHEIISKEKVTYSGTAIDYKRYEFIFEIKKNHKGKKNSTNSQVTIITTGGGADCGNYFKKNETYLIYAYKTKRKLDMMLSDQTTDSEFMTTNMCTRTKKLKFFTFWEQLVLELT